MPNYFPPGSLLGVATGTSLALGGATIGSNALAVTGTFQSITSGTSIANLLDAYAGSAANPNAILRARSARGTSGSPTAVSSADDLFSIVASGYDGSAFTRSSQITFDSDGTIGVGQVPGAIYVYTADSGGTLRLCAKFDSAQKLTLSGALAAGGPSILKGYTVGTLPTGTQGGRVFVTDSNAASFTAGIGAVVAAGASTVVPVFYDGTNWRIG